MPTIEQHSANDETSPMSAQAVSDPAGGTKGKGKYVKVTWWRPHGQTAIAPGEPTQLKELMVGLKKMTLKVRLDDGSKTVSRSPMADDSWLLGPTELFGPNRAPSALIMRHLMILFEEHFGSQLPFLDFKRLQEDLDAGNGQVFLLNCIAACAARWVKDLAVLMIGSPPTLRLLCPESSLTNTETHSTRSPRICWARCCLSRPGRLWWPSSCSVTWALETVRSLWDRTDTRL